MTSDIRDYLLDRFRSDAATLRQRAASLKGSNKSSPGPNAAVSTAMADACDDVVQLVERLPTGAPVEDMLNALRLLLPELTLRSTSPAAAAAPAVKSVFVGACTRVQELIAAESSASDRRTEIVDDDDAEDEDGLDADDTFDDDEFSDDDEDLDDDDLFEDPDDSHADGGDHGSQNGSKRGVE